jgi:hypothetical protein
MTHAYNPIVRNFCQFRAGVLESIDVDRLEVRPGTPLEGLLPITARREIWRRLRGQGLRLPPLDFSRRDHCWNILRVLKATASTALYFQRWYALLVAFPVALVVYSINRHRAVHIPLGLKTVGEMVIYATCFAEHKASGYRWTKNEIALKVRMTIAESTGRSLDAIQPETKLAEL